MCSPHAKPSTSRSGPISTRYTRRPEAHPLHFDHFAFYLLRRHVRDLMVHLLRILEEHSSMEQNEDALYGVKTLGVHSVVCTEPDPRRHRGGTPAPRPLTRMRYRACSDDLATCSPPRGHRAPKLWRISRSAAPRRATRGSTWTVRAGGQAHRWRSIVRPSRKASSDLARRPQLQIAHQLQQAAHGERFRQKLGATKLPTDGVDLKYGPILCLGQLVHRYARVSSAHTPSLPPLHWLASVAARQ